MVKSPLKCVSERKSVISKREETITAQNTQHTHEQASSSGLHSCPRGKTKFPKIRFALLFLFVLVLVSYRIYSNHFRFEYGTADITVNIAVDITCEVSEQCKTPKHVAIISRPHEEDGSTQNIQSFQPVRNQEMENGKPSNGIYPKKKPSNGTAPLLACGVPVQSDPIIKVGDHKTYVIGSYVEHRSTPKMIKTVSIVLRSEEVKYSCLLCCDGRNISVAANYSIHSDHFGFEYGTADITCEVPEKCKTPKHVAITSRAHEEDGSIQNIQSFQPVRNQEEKKDKFTYDFTVCISAMYDYTNVLGLVQAMEMFKILGVQKVVIYKSSCHPDPQKILDYYVNQNFVEIIPWSVEDHINVSRGWRKSVSPGELHYFGQIPALNDCLYRYMYQSRYIALQDLDELILPVKEENWTGLISQLEKNHPGTAVFEFENYKFPLSYTGDERPEYELDSWKQVEGKNILQHIHRILDDAHKFENFKFIVNPRFVSQPTVHGVLKLTDGKIVWVDSELARLYHMRNMSRADFLGKTMIEDTRLRDYADKLIPAVSKVLRETFKIG